MRNILLFDQRNRITVRPGVLCGYQLELADEEKINIQQYITKIYGSFTSFNVLFKQPEHYFVGERLMAETA